jgi:hypothetical protein
VDITVAMDKAQDVKINIGTPVASCYSFIFKLEPHPNLHMFNQFYSFLVFWRNRCESYRCYNILGIFFHFRNFVKNIDYSLNVVRYSFFLLSLMFL